MLSPDVVFALTGDVRRNSRALRQLRTLAGLGCSVEVLTLGPPASHAPFEPGIHLHVLPEPTARGPRFFARIHRDVRRAAMERPARVYHASDLYTLPALAAAARRHGGRLVYDARELYPYVASTAGRPWTTYAWRWIESRYIHRANAVFTVSESIAGHLSRLYGVARPAVLYNVPPRRDVRPSPWLREHTGIAPDRALILHQGQMRPDRGCTRLVDAMRDVPNATLVFLGDGPLKPILARQVDAHGLHDRIRFIDPVPPDALLPVTAGADVGVTLLEDTCLNHRFALPNKLFEYLMAGLPVLGSDLPEIRRVVAGFGVGCVVDPADRGALVAAMTRMAGDAAARTRWTERVPEVLETFSWEKASQLFIRHYQDLLNRTGPS